MYSPTIRRFAGMIAAALLTVAVAGAPGVAAAAAPPANTTSDVMSTPQLQFKPDMVVTGVGVTKDAKGNTYYQFKIKNAGMGLAKNVQVKKVFKIKDLSYPQNFQTTTTVLEYDAIPAGQEKPITILCEYSQLYTCIYGSVEVTVENPETTTVNNYVSQTS